jgi:hypothetical protein
MPAQGAFLSRSLRTKLPNRQECRHNADETHHHSRARLGTERHLSPLAWGSSPPAWAGRAET